MRMYNSFFNILLKLKKMIIFGLECYDLNPYLFLAFYINGYEFVSVPPEHTGTLSGVIRKLIFTGMWLRSDHWNVAGIEACHFTTEWVKSQGVLPHILSLFLAAGGERSKTAEPQKRRNNPPHHTKREPPRRLMGDFPGGPVARSQHCQCRGAGFNPWSET